MSSCKRPVRAVSVCVINLKCVVCILWNTMFDQSCPQWATAFVQGLLVGLISKKGLICLSNQAHQASIPLLFRNALMLARTFAKERIQRLASPVWKSVIKDQQWRYVTRQPATVWWTIKSKVIFCNARIPCKSSLLLQSDCSRVARAIQNQYCQTT